MNFIKQLLRLLLIYNWYKNKKTALGRGRLLQIERLQILPNKPSLILLWEA